MSPRSTKPAPKPPAAGRPTSWPRGRLPTPTNTWPSSRPCAARRCAWKPSGATGAGPRARRGLREAKDAERMPLFGKDLGIHLGTVNTVICEGDEIVLHEPTVVAVDSDELKIVEVGHAAREMDGRVPEMIEVMRPLREGVIADFEVTQRMLGYFIEKVCGPARLFKPRVMITVPFGVTSVESRAVHEAALQAGSREVFLIQEPLAAAIGIGLPIATPSGN